MNISSHLNSVWVFPGTYVVLTMTPGPGGRYFLLSLDFTLSVMVSHFPSLSTSAYGMLKKKKKKECVCRNFSGLLVYSDLELLA